MAARFPDRVALDIPPNLPDRPRRTRVTYQELAHRADEVSAWLTPVARRDAVVAIFLPRESPDLYAAQLGAMKAGAAYTCLDLNFPDEHVRRVLDEATPVAVITDANGHRRLAQLGNHSPTYISGVMTCPLADRSRGQSQDDSQLAYVVFTSGTTGRPKGVLIEHRGVVNLVASNVSYFGLTPTDRVAQCSSSSYDSSAEETWLAFAVGATLVPLDDQTVRLGPDLVEWLRAERITTLCPPPTLLRSTGCEDPSQVLPDLRLLYVGGEPLPRDLADRWAVGRRMENGYGPTECTVTVVRGPVVPGKPVTIGRPVVGHQVWVLDEDLNELPDGKTGELCVGGVGLARGYHKLEALTTEKFPTHPLFGRIYRTGDAVRRTASGELEHHGRLDGQVKVRGFRIELAAIEAALERCAGVRAAACRVQGAAANQLIAAHIVPVDPRHPPSVEDLRATLRRDLPTYMVPTRFGLLDQLPTRVGGKLNRDDLPDVAVPVSTSNRPGVAATGDRQQAVIAAFARALNRTDPLSVDDDFFLDLGGDSLTAVSAIVSLRAAGHGSVTVRNLYDLRTAVRLVEVLTDCAPTPDVRRVEPSPRAGSPVLSTLAQSLWLALVLVGSSAISSGVIVELLPAMLGGLGSAATVTIAPFVAVLGFILFTMTAVAWTVLTKWVLIGRYQKGQFPVWGGFYTRHWIVTHMARLIPWWLVEGTVFQAVILRALGAHVGSRVYLHRGVDLTSGGWDLLTLGNDVTVNQDARISPVELVDGHVVLGSVLLEDGATLDVRSGVSRNTTISRNGCLSALSWLPPGGHVGTGERWDGVPARPAGLAPPTPTLTGGAELSPLAHGVLTVLGRCARSQVPFVGVAVLSLFLAVVVPDLDTRFTAWLADPELTLTGMAIVGALAVGSLPLSLIGQAVLMRALGRVRAGVYSQWSLAAIRINLKTGVVDSANRWLSGSLYWPWWLRLAGMRIGHGCEISTIIDVVPETVTVGAESFFADGIYFCGAERRRGTVTVAETVVGRETFLGNHAVLPAGGRWPAGLFVGVSTVANAHQVRPGSAWFGHPPMELPRREVRTTDRRLTHRPGPLRFGNRLVWETLRFALPLVPLPVAWAWYWCILSAPVGLTARLLVVAPAATLAAQAILVLVTIALKWCVLWRVRPGQHPLWSCWCSRWDFVYVAWGYLAQRSLAALEGTLLLNAALRLTGMTIGRRVVLGSGFSQVVDPDMIVIENGATVTADFQAHTFEDRVLKIDRLRIGAFSTVGAHAVVFYGADVGDRAHVAPHSVVMKCESLAADGRYAGCPTATVDKSVMI